MRTKKDATITRQVDATSQDVGGHMCAEGAEDQIHYIDVNAVRINSPLHYDAWQKGLKNHPDNQYVNYLLKGIKSGVSIGYDANAPRDSHVHPNWPSVNKYHEHVQESIQKDIFRGRKLGPWSHPPTQNFVGSPMGAFEKKHSSGKYRVIHDLSWPPGHSVNSYITEDCSVQYITIDDIAQKVKSFGVKGVKMAKLDLADAYKHIIVRKEDIELLGSTFCTVSKSGEVMKQYYMEVVLPFGLKSSAKIFTDYADGLQYIMYENGVTVTDHYLDDYFTCGHPDSMECETYLVIMVCTCNQLGLGV